jgi:hypothetical protein
MLFLTVQAFAGGGWPQPKGKSYLKLGQWWVISDQHFTDNGGIDPNVTNGIFNTSLYGEYGFTDRLTGILYFPFFSRALYNNTVSATTGEIITPGEAINSIGDTDLGLKYNFFRKGSLVVSATLTLGIPLGEDRGGAAGILQTGDGEFNQLFQLDAGTGLTIGKVSTYFNVYAGYNNRTRGFSDEFRFGVEGGVNLFQDRLTAIFRLYGIESLKNGALNELITSTTIFANNSEHLTVAPELAYRIRDNWGVTAGFATAIAGELIFAAPAYSVGVFAQF